MLCSQVAQGFKINTWFGAGLNNPNVLEDQPFITYDFGAGYYIIKVVNWETDGVTPREFEVRGKDAYKSQPYDSTGDDMETCSVILGSKTYLGPDPTFPTPAGYTKGVDNVYRSNGTCPQPTITTQPSSVNINTGDTINLSVVATGVTGYKWKKGADYITGATSSTYTKANAQASDAGQYSCEVINNCGGGLNPGKRFSNNVNVTVNASTGSFDIGFRDTMEITGNCDCNTTQFAFSKTISDRSLLSESDWQDSGDKTFTESGDWFVHARLTCNHADGDTRKFNISSTTQKATPIQQ